MKAKVLRYEIETLKQTQDVIVVYQSSVANSIVGFH